MYAFLHISFFKAFSIENKAFFFYNKDNLFESCENLTIETNASWQIVFEIDWRSNILFLIIFTILSIAKPFTELRGVENVSDSWFLFVKGRLLRMLKEGL